MSAHVTFVDIIVVQLWKCASKSAIVAEKRNFVEVDRILYIYRMYYVCRNFNIDIYYIRTVIHRLTLKGIPPIIVKNEKKGCVGESGGSSCAG